MSSSTRKTLHCQHSYAINLRISTHQLKPPRGFSGSATIPPAMVAARCALWRVGSGSSWCTSAHGHVAGGRL